MGIDRETLRQLEILVRPLATRIRNTVARAVVQLVDDGRKQQMLQLGVHKEEDVPDGEHFQPYGFSSVPLPGAEAVALFPSGDRERPYVVGVSDRRYRPTGGQGGEVFMYTDEGDIIRLGRGNIISISTSGEVRIGSTDASEPPALASELEALKSAIDTWVPVPNDGGASLKAVFSAWSAPGATKVKVE